MHIIDDNIYICISTLFEGFDPSKQKMATDFVGHLYVFLKALSASDVSL